MKRTLIIASISLVLTLALAGVAAAAPLSLTGNGKFAVYADSVSIGARYGVTKDITVGAGTLGTDQGLVVSGCWQATNKLLVAADYYLIPDTSPNDDMLEAGAYFTLAGGGNMALVAGGGFDYTFPDVGDSSIDLFGLAELQIAVSGQVVFYQNLRYEFDTDGSSLDFGGAEIGIQYSF